MAILITYRLGNSIFYKRKSLPSIQNQFTNMSANIVSLEGHNNVDTWIKAVENYASTKATTVYDHGLLSQVVSDPVWANLEGNTLENGDIKPRPETTRPILQLAANTNALAIYKILKEEFDIVNNESKDLKQNILQSIGSDNQSGLEDNVTGFRSVTSKNIVDEMLKLYNLPTAHTIKSLHTDLNKLMTGEQDFRQFMTVFRATVQKLTRAGQPPSDFLQIQSIIKATANHAVISKAVDSYLDKFPLLADQKPAALVEHIILRVPNHATASTLGYANAALSKEDITKMINDARAEGVKEGRQQVTKSSAVKNQHIKEANRYCFFHGYNISHTGLNCKFMANNADYTPAMKAATSHKDNGGSEFVQVIRK